ncbi:MAG: hypothetical protein DRJ05_06675 [Bacteroidetes bacterium]|nr:MAG: hypothetical protein DRJ05_06675 [Bacteroidota bacterium]
MNKYKNVTLEDLSKNEDLSARTYNVCKNHQLSDLEKILDYYIANYNFFGFRGVGEKTNRELTILTKKHVGVYLLKTKRKVELKKEGQKIIEIINNLSLQQTNVLNCIVMVKFKKLSSESIRSLEGFFESGISIGEFKRHIFSNPFFDICDLNVTGIDARKEIDLFLKNTKKLIQQRESMETSDILMMPTYPKSLLKASIKRSKGKKRGYSNLLFGMPVLNVISAKFEKKIG